MNRFIAPTAVLIAGLVVTVSGCAMSGGGTATPRAFPEQMSPAMPGLHPAAAAGISPVTAAPESSVTAASFIGDLPATGGPGSVGDSCIGCNDSACINGGCPAAAPYGYAPLPAIYNLYGIDPHEFLCDGGDHDPPARLLRNDTITGLQPEDTVVHYTTTAGDIEFQASNRVCVYAPRFGSVRKVTSAIAGQGIVGAVGVRLPVGPNRVEFNQPRLMLADALTPARSEATRRLDAMRERNRGIPVEGVWQLEQATDVLAALAGLSVLEIERLQREELAVLQRAAIAAVTWSTNLTLEVAIEDIRPPVLTRDQSVEGVTVYDFPDTGRLRILKLADRQHAQPGEIVSFAIRVDNVGDAPVNQIVITDNLTTRLEYVAGSESCDVDADFTTEPNQAGSLRLEWKLSDELAVGETVSIRFECLVR